MSTHPTRISQSPTSGDVIHPIKMRAHDALQALLRRRQRRRDTDPRLMQRGDERC